MSKVSQNIIEKNIVHVPRVACDGGALYGHPRVYLEVGESGKSQCPYCGQLFIYKPKDALPNRFKNVQCCEMTDFSVKSPSQRQLSVSELVRRLVSQVVLSKEIYHPRLEDEVITFPFVKMSADLKLAVIHTDCVNKESLREVLQVLQEVSPAIKKIIAPKLKLRYMPEIKFVKDDVTLHQEKVLKIMDSFSANRDLVSEG